MRIKKRLHILYKFFKSKKNFKFYLRDIVQLQSKNQIEYWSSFFFEKYGEIKSFHLKNPDLRFSQILQFYGLYQEGFWFYKEDEEVLIELGMKASGCLYWGVNYSKDLKKLKVTKYVLIKDLDTEHIQAILDGNYTKNELYLKTFKQELKCRN